MQCCAYLPPVPKTLCTVACLRLTFNVPCCSYFDMRVHGYVILIYCACATVNTRYCCVILLVRFTFTIVSFSSRVADFVDVVEIFIDLCVRTGGRSNG